MGGKKKEPKVTQVPLQSPEQSQFLKMLLGGMTGYMGESPFGQMPTLGERYGGGRPAPSTGAGKGGTAPGAAPGVPGGKGGTAPGRGGPLREMPPGANVGMPGGPSSGMLEALLAGPEQGLEVGQATEALTAPIISPFTQGQTGNFPRRRTAGGGR